MVARAVLLALLVLLASIARVESAPVLPTDFVDETLVTGLNLPVGMAILPDGRILFTEQYTAKVRMVIGTHVAATDPIVTVPNVSIDDPERGLQGIAVDPRWPTFPYVYVCFTRTDGWIALVRFTASGDLSNPAGENLSLGSPYVVIDKIPDVNGWHNGLGLRFQTDGTLLMSSGDDSYYCEAQDPTSFRGKLLRMDVTRVPAGAGGPAPYAMIIPTSGNPFATNPDSVARIVYAYGLRNPWRFHVDSSTGAIMLGDVGLNDYEEVDEVFPGDNFGWPFREGLLIHTWPDCFEPGGPGASTYVAPVLAMERSTGFSCITTAGVYRPVTGAAFNWPTLYWGNAFFGDFYTSRLRRLVRTGQGWAVGPQVLGQPNDVDWATDIHYCSDWAEGSDGSMYRLQYLDDNGNPGTGMVRRIRYTGPPVAVDPIPTGGPTLRAGPNPFREAIVLSWRISAPGEARIDIFDVTGRRVRRLEERSPNGEGRTTWDGRDDRGMNVPAGVYLARMTNEPLAPMRLLRLN